MTKPVPAPAAPKPRQRRSPEEKALEAYGVACRKVEHVDEQIASHEAELKRLRDERTPLVAHRDYLGQNPYLPASARGEAEEIPADES